MKKALIILLLAIPLASSAQKQYKNGYYFTDESNKFAGQIKLIRASVSVFGSKPTSIRIKRGDQNKKLKLKDMKGFVIEKDSFALISNFEINSIGGRFEKDFAKVLEKGKINLYIHYSSSSDGKFVYTLDRYVLNKAGSDKYYGIYDRDSHKQYLLSLIKDNAELTDQVKNMSKKEWIEEIPFIIRKYNSN